MMMMMMRMMRMMMMMMVMMVMNMIRAVVVVLLMMMTTMILRMTLTTMTRPCAGSQHQELQEPALADAPHLQLAAPPAPHRHAAAERPDGALVADALPDAPRVPLAQGVLLLVQQSTQPYGESAGAECDCDHVGPGTGDLRPPLTIPQDCLVHPLLDAHRMIRCFIQKPQSPSTLLTHPLLSTRRWRARAPSTTG
jgi:hypothetical protein